MRLLLTMRALADTAFDTKYHHKLRGRIWPAFEGTEYDEEHDMQVPGRFTFSNPFPWDPINEGDERHLLIASPDEKALSLIAEDIDSDPVLEIGEMKFKVTDQQLVIPDVGEPGTKGELETATGVVCRIRPDEKEKYGIDDEYDGDTYWRPEHTVLPFKEKVRQNLQYKHELYHPDYIPGPDDKDWDLFEGFELIKTYALPVEVTSGVTETHVLSKWRLSYVVQDDAHRKNLNLLLDCGLGERNSLGFGFVNIPADIADGDDTEQTQLVM